MNVKNNSEKITNNKNSQQNMYNNNNNNKLSNSSLHRNYLTLDSYNNKSSINSISSLPYQELKTPLRNEFKNETRNNIDNTFKINSYTPNRNYNSNNINDTNSYNNYSNNDTKIKTQILSLQNRLNLYE